MVLLWFFYLKFNELSLIRSVIQSHSNLSFVARAVFARCAKLVEQ